MDNKIQIFNNEDFGNVRVLMIDGAPCFVGTDVATALGYADTFGALKKHVDDEDKLVCQIDSAGQKRDATIINESGLYSLILRSNLDSAKKFKRWVTSEILPTIRKTGSYSVQKQLPPVSYALEDVKTTFEQIQSLFAVKRGIALCQAIDIVGKKHDVELDELKQLLAPAEHETGYMNATQLAPKIGVRSSRFANEKLARLGLQYRAGGDWRLSSRTSVNRRIVGSTKQVINRHVKKVGKLDDVFKFWARSAVLKFLNVADRHAKRVRYALLSGFAFQTQTFQALIQIHGNHLTKRLDTSRGNVYTCRNAS